MIPEVEVIAQKACAMFSDFLEDHYQPSSVVILIAPVDQPSAVIGTSNVDEKVTEKILDYFVGFGQEKWKPMLTSDVVAIAESSDNEPMVEVVQTVPIPRVSSPFDVNELAARGCELIVELFGINGYEVECFVAICSRIPPVSHRSVTGASTASRTIINKMIYHYLDNDDDERALEDES